MGCLKIDTNIGYYINTMNTMMPVENYTWFKL